MQLAKFPTTRILILIAAVEGNLPSPLAAQDQAVKHRAINSVRPEYPAEAKARHFTGSGVVVVQIDQRTGYVISARMLKSTGHKILDDAALKAFRQWHFRPGTNSEVRIPINYSIAGKP